jgi:hypothetical protein
MTDRKLLRTAIAGAVGAVRRGDGENVLDGFGRLAEDSGLSLRESVLELAGANVEMLRTLMGPDSDQDLLRTLADGGGEGLSGSIDEVEPAQRASARVLLALAGGHAGDAEIQLDIVAGAPGSDETGYVFAHTVSWTLELLEVCADNDRPVPRWLRPVLR